MSSFASLTFVSPIKMSARNANSITKYIEKSGTQFFIQKNDKDRIICANSIVGLLSSGINKNNEVTIYCDNSVDRANAKLLEFRNQIISLA